MKTRVRALLLSCLVVYGLAVPASRGQSVYTAPYTFTTLAGVAQNGGNANGTNSAALFYYPVNVALDRTGNLFVADTYNHTIRKMTPVGTNWDVTTIAGAPGDPGSANGNGSDARFFRPYGVAVDTAGNVFVADTLNDQLRKLTPVGTNWVVSTIAGSAGNPGSSNGTNSDARFNGPNGIAVDATGSVYVADLFNHVIRKATPTGTNFVVSTIAGLAGSPGFADGTNTDARFNLPIDVDLDIVGNVYVVDHLNSTIRKITPMGTNWAVTTLAGSPGNAGSTDGTGTAALFSFPRSIAVDGAGNLHVVDTGNNCIRRITPAGVVTTLAGAAGTDGSANDTGSAARFFDPRGAGVDSTGTLYVADYGNHTIRKGTPPAGFPTFTLHPQAQFIGGGAVTLSAAPTGTGPVAYQWLLNGMVVTNATSGTLALPGSTPSNAGAYSLVASNALGSIASLTAALSFFGDLRFNSSNAEVTLAGPPGASYLVDHADALGPVITWSALTNVSLAVGPSVVTDSQSAGRTNRFYRARLLP